jgi:hypothetical protein
LAGPPVDQSFDVVMYDVDLFDNDASIIAALHAQGRRIDSLFHCSLIHCSIVH